MTSITAIDDAPTPATRLRYHEHVNGLFVDSR